MRRGRTRLLLDDEIRSNYTAGYDQARGLAYNESNLGSLFLERGHILMIISRETEYTSSGSKQKAQPTLLILKRSSWRQCINMCIPTRDGLPDSYIKLMLSCPKQCRQEERTTQVQFR